LNTRMVGLISSEVVKSHQCTGTQKIKKKEKPTKTRAAKGVASVPRKNEKKTFCQK